MTFFNQKENILQLKLTNYGEDMLSEGKFKPVYYSFSDEGVNYRFVTPSEEGQNDIDGRIKLETPYLKVQKNRFSNSQDGKTVNISGVDFETVVAKRESLGKCATATSASSRIKIFVLDNEIESYNNFYTSSNSLKPDVSIPQIDINLEFETAISDFTNPDVPFTPDAGISARQVFTDGGAVYVSSEGITLLLEEQGTISQFDNFEIEVYEILDESESSVDELRKLTFQKQIDDLYVSEDGLYVSEEERTKNLNLINKYPNTTDDVEYYFNVFTDAYGEIPESFICSLVGEIRKKEFALDSSIDALCPREVPSELATIRNPYEDGLPDSDKC